jgi:transglutaminase-like putative cysteine protease
VNRRSFIQAGSGALLSSALPKFACAATSTQDNAAAAAFAPSPQNWRVFDVTTRVALNSAARTRRVWLPLPSVSKDSWVRPIGDTWRGNAATMRRLTESPYGAQMLFAQWQDNEPAPVLEVVSRFASRDRKIDPDKRGDYHLSARERQLYTQATRLIPVDGIVRRTAKAAAGHARSDFDKAQAIYQWIVENSARDPKTRGCGLGDIGSMLETGNLRGKCADINTLFVGMCRALEIPARDIYGVRVAESRFGYRSLGASGDISKAQHCRAEVFLRQYGWTPVDAADVRKVVLEEQPGLTLSHPLVKPVRERLFGAWEGNWMPYNFAHDVELPMSGGPALPFFMYPQAETSGGWLDSLDPASFRYGLTSTEIALGR